MSNEHTPTPWMVSKEQDNQYVIRHPVEKWDLASCWYPRAAIRKGDKDSEEFWDSLRDEQDANAAHIVKCVNSHDALVEALEKMVDTFYCSIEPATSLDGCYTNDPHEITARAALTAAQGDK